MTSSNSSSSLATWPEKAQSEITRGAAPKLFLIGFCTVLDPSARSEEMLTGGGTGDRDLLQLALLERSKHTTKWGLCVTSQSAWSLGHPSYTCASGLPSRVNQWLTAGRNPGRTISLGCSPETYNAHAALTGSNAVPTGLAHMDKFLSHSRS